MGIAHIYYQNTAIRFFWVIVARCCRCAYLKHFSGSVWLGVARCGSVCISRATLGRCGSVCVFKAFFRVGVGRCAYLKHFSGSVWLGLARCGSVWAGVSWCGPVCISIMHYFFVLFALLTLFEFLIIAFSSMSF